MRPLLVLFAFLCACSTVESRREQTPVFQQLTAASLSTFQGCFAEKTASQDVSYLPKAGGGSFSAGAGPQHYVFWVVDVDDLGSQRRVSLYAVNAGTGRQMALPAIQACL